jgi:SAM-dependent methyltransferase
MTTFRCGLCDGGVRPWLTVPTDWRRPGSTGPYRVYWCDACRHGALLPRPTPEEVAAAYRVDYYTHKDRTDGGSRLALADRVRVHLAWRADQGTTLTPEVVARWVRASGRVCDLGCGHGRLLAGVAQRGLDVVGVEPDPVAREVARGLGLTVLEGTAEALPEALPRGDVDLVLLSHSLEHCREPVVAMRNVTSLLRPGGVAIVEVPNNEAVGAREAGAMWPWLDVPRHLSFFTGHSLRRLCGEVGLVPLATDYVGYCRQFMNGWLEQQKEIGANLGLRGAPGAWTLLLRTVGASHEAKYDSVRVVARRPAS